MMILQNRTVNPDITYYLFLDIETCYESNYPNYGKSYYGNCDAATSAVSSSPTVPSSSTRLLHTRQRRRTKYSSFYIKHFHPKSSHCYDFENCHYIQKELQTNLIFQKQSSSSTINHPNQNHHAKNKLILLDCRGNGQRQEFRHPHDNNSNVMIDADTDTKSTINTGGSSPHVVMASLSSTLSQLKVDYGDQGLPPPTIQHIPYRTSSSSSSTTITTTFDDGQYQQEILLEDCSTTTTTTTTTTAPSRRKYLLSFSGDYKRHAIRQELAKLDNVRTKSSSSTSVNSESSLVLITDTKELYQNTNGMTYSELLLSSLYVAVPRGDNLYSYRFSEVLSSGAIPVLIHNEEWVLPFRPEIVDWDRCVIRISAEEIQNSVSILERISLQEQCQRRQYCYSIYERYIINSSATIQGILDGLQAIQQKQLHSGSI